MCLFEGEIRWIENFGEKMDLCVIWLEEKEKKPFMWSPHKICLSTVERKLDRESLIVKWQNCPCAVQLPLFFSYVFLSNVASFFLIYFFSFDFLGVVLCFCFFFLRFPRQRCLLFSFLFSFDFLGIALCVCFFLFN